MDFHPLLRTLGLRILARIPFLPSPSKIEEPEPVIRNSLLVALARASIHILPVLTSVTVISLNLAHLYLGRTIPGPILDNTITIAILQVCAKLQELLIIASLTTIVFSVIRSQLISGAGVPLGFLCSGFTFSQLSYFWSEEFCGAIGARMPRHAKSFLILMLLVAGLIATTAGPSVAVLLVPRQQYWKAGGTDFYLRGSTNELFPDVMAVSPSNLSAECFGLNATKHATCPSGGSDSLSTYLSQHPAINNGANIGPAPSSVFGQFATLEVEIASGAPKIPPSTLTGSIRGVACQTAVVAPYLPTIMYQNSLRDDWGVISGTIQWNINKAKTASIAEYRYNYGITLSTSVQVPAVRTICSPAQNISAQNTAGGALIDFPVIPNYSCAHDMKSTAVPELNNTSSDSLRVTWIKLSSEFGAVSTGLVFESPWFGNGTSRVVVGCSIDARWARGTVDGKSGLPQSMGSPQQWGRAAELNTFFRPLDDGSWNPITLDKTWLQALTPYQASQSHDGRNLTSFESLLASSAMIDNNFTTSEYPEATWNYVQSGSSNRTLYLEWAITLLIADGLSRFGTDKALNMSGPVSDWSLLDYNKRPNFDSELLHGGQALYPPDEQFTTFHLGVTIDGLSYQARSITDYLAIIVLLTHILLALTHTAYLIWTRQSSAAWDSIPEVLALAYNSYPTPALQNTSAGIRCIETYRKLAIVRETRREAGAGPPDASTPQLELVFDSDIHTPPNKSQDSASIGALIRASFEASIRTAEGSIIELNQHSRNNSDSHLPLVSDQARAQRLSLTGVRERRQGRTKSRVLPDRLYA
jgi:hypothetical protein